MTKVMQDAVAAREARVGHDGARWCGVAASRVRNEIRDHLEMRFSDRVVEVDK